MATIHAPAMDRRQTPDRRAAPREQRSGLFGAFEIITMVLLIVAGLDLGILGLLDVDVIGSVFGPESAWTRAIYVLLGVAALYSILLTMFAQMVRRD